MVANLKLFRRRLSENSVESEPAGRLLRLGQQNVDCIGDSIIWKLAPLSRNEARTQGYERSHSLSPEQRKPNRKSSRYHEFPDEGRRLSTEVRPLCGLEDTPVVQHEFISDTFFGVFEENHKLYCVNGVDGASREITREESRSGFHCFPAPGPLPDPLSRAMSASGGGPN